MELEVQIDPLRAHAERYRGKLAETLHEGPTRLDGHQAYETTYDAGDRRTTLLLVRPPVHLEFERRDFVLAFALISTPQHAARHRRAFVSLARRVDFAPRAYEAGQRCRIEAPSS